jgi:SAM-dependent methyltransferase
VNQRLKQETLRALRLTGLLSAAELLHRHWHIRGATPDNDQFCREHPDFIPPPLELMHDAYASSSYRTYWSFGKFLAQFFADLIRKYEPAPNRALEWGCGPARILRHMPELFPKTQFFGTDYNRESIAWCQRAIKNINFQTNGALPPLSFADQYFDVIYAVSVLTHLSLAQQEAWLAELRRIAKTGVHLVLTTNGYEMARVLLPAELSRLRRDGFVVRGNVKEGKRVFLSYTSPEYVRERLFAGLDICEHIAGKAGGPATEQDIWVVRNDRPRRNG